ncbi:54S ribosomal protein L35, mitochondrial [[Candida] jaroonii]|uniref:54S ribosomal protein L35, mitochondrial n=1 Tax=[Candida] jaroonii TaxID=467808 RepID=A0ACA9Y8S3_9ASCO|nr:54S ribosomal protein L35, mitochondrial [[Candida] jaroonii]
MLRIFKRSLNSGKGIWSNFSNRSETLKVQNIKPHAATYHSPLLIDDAFKSAYEILQQESEKIYQRAQTVEKDDLKDKLLSQAESKNPEVLYNIQNGNDLDITQPVYRNHLKKQWENYDLMILMQRLEQFKVIPDTLPTIQPTVDVKVKFPHITNGEFNRWIVPGEFLPSFLTKQPPTIKLQQFDNYKNESKLFSIVLINPDEPNLETNSFKTTLNFGVSNLSLSLTDDSLDVTKYLKYENGSEEFSMFKSYEPILPEVNAGDYQRACLFVFEQPEKINVDQINAEDFDIRSFVNNYNLSPVGGTMWRQKYDRSVNDVRSEYGLSKGRVFHRVRKPFPLI